MAFDIMVCSHALSRHRLLRVDQRVAGYQERKLYYNGREQDHILQTTENGIHGQLVCLLHGL